jgi:AcrR family transcriptional regulator
MEREAPASPKTDRRIQRTETLLRKALVDLILEKGYDAITVQDLLDRANLGRSTFYAHYRDKEDLLLSGFQALFDAFLAEYRKTAPANTDPTQAGKDLCLFFFRHAGSHRGLFRAMVGDQGGRIIQDHLLRYITRFLRDHLAALFAGNQPQVPVDLLAHYIASSYLSLLSWWLDHDLAYTAEQMDRLFQQLVVPGVREILGNPQPE